MLFLLRDATCAVPVITNIRRLQMDDCIAIAVRGKDGAIRYFLTRGRAWGPTDVAPYLAAVSSHCGKYAGCADPATIEVCYSLRDAAHAPYFFECLQCLQANPTPVDKLRSEITSGRLLLYCGDPAQREASRPSFWSMT